MEQSSEIGAGASTKGTLIPTVHVTGPEDIVAAPWWIDGQRAPLKQRLHLAKETIMFWGRFKWSQKSGLKFLYLI